MNHNIPCTISSSQHFEKDDNNEEMVIFLVDLCTLCTNSIFLCNYTKELIINLNNPFSVMNDITTECFSLVCPKCAKLNDEFKFVAYHLFIKHLIYVQSGENDKELDKLIYSDDSYFNWCLGDPFDVEMLNNFKEIKKDYNRYGIDLIKIKQEQNDNFDGVIYALCICNNCGFECSAQIYAEL